MTWVAPEVERDEPPAIADERSMLTGWLTFHRQTLLAKCTGLATEQLRLRAAEPSNLSLLGLVRHMAEVERSWWQRRVAGRDVDFLYCDLENNPDGDFDDVEEADAEAAFATFAREIDEAQKIAETRSLDETFFHTHRQVEMSVRWVYVHMIEEYARHNGHADLLREQIDGVTGS
jgi:uncharacterized damage-inducible protein DinB